MIKLVLSFAVVLALLCLVGCGSDESDMVKPTAEQMSGGNVNKDPRAREAFKNGGGGGGGGGRSGMQSGVTK